MRVTIRILAASTLCLLLVTPLCAQTGPQTVTVKIDYDAEEKHLKLADNPSISKAAGNTIRWRVEISDAALKSEVKRAKLWFPDPILSGSNEVEIEISNGIGNSQPTPLADVPTGTYPVAVYCDADGGEKPGRDRKPKPTAKQWEQKGKQMVEGTHSHGEVDVGP